MVLKGGVRQRLAMAPRPATCKALVVAPGSTLATCNYNTVSIVQCWAHAFGVQLPYHMIGMIEACRGCDTRTLARLAWVVPICVSVVGFHVHGPN